MVEGVREGTAWQEGCSHSDVGRRARGPPHAAHLHQSCVHAVVLHHEPQQPQQLPPAQLASDVGPLVAKAADHAAVAGQHACGQEVRQKKCSVSQLCNVAQLPGG